MDEAIFKNDGALASNLCILSKVWIIKSLQIIILFTGLFSDSQIVEYKKSIELNNIEILSDFKNNNVNKWLSIIPNIGYDINNHSFTVGLSLSQFTNHLMHKQRNIIEFQKLAASLHEASESKVYNLESLLFEFETNYNIILLDTTSLNISRQLFQINHFKYKNLEITTEDYLNKYMNISDKYRSIIIQCNRIEKTARQIKAVCEHEKHFLIDYYNTINNQINYSTGIRHRIRIPYVLQLKWKPNSSQELYVTDKNTILLESTVREFYDFNCRPLPTAMAQKIILALSLDRLFIDGQSYIMEGEPEATPFGDANLYQVKATLVKADYVFDSNSDIINQDIVVDGTPLAIIPNQKGMLFIN